MDNVLVIGAGFMGTGIAQACAQSGYQVHIMDKQANVLDKAMDTIRQSVAKMGSKGLLKDSPEAVTKRLTVEHDLSCAAKADWVIEAIVEIEDLKKDLFQRLEQIVTENTPLATNTSTIPITRIAEATKHPDRVLGLHFFGPVPLMKLVEVIKGEKTSDYVFERGVGFVESLGKTPLRVRKDIPGFVLNRIFAGALSEALELVAKGVASIEDIDTGMKLGYGWSAGPFEMVDLGGVDTCFLLAQSLKALGEGYPATSYKLIEQMVKEGHLGQKVGKGFYTYTADGKKLPSVDTPTRTLP